MIDNRIPTHLWVTAFIRSCFSRGIPVTLIHKGEKVGGTVLFKLFQSIDACRVLAQMHDSDDNIKWYPIHKEEIIDEKEASSLIHFALNRDPDLWVVEVETLDINLPFDECF